MKILMISNHLGVQSGVQRYVQNLLLHLDTAKYRVTLFVGQCPPDQASTAPALEAHGVEILAVPDNKKDRIRALAAHLRTHKDYDIIHYHTASKIGAPVCGMMRVLCPRAKIVVHSHIVYPPMTLTWRAAHLVYQLFADYFLGCGVAAGRFVFGDHIDAKPNFSVACNAVDAGRFHPDAAARAATRAAWGITDTDQLAGFVGRLNHQKNPLFLMEVFAAMAAQDPHWKLLLVGTGEMEPEMRAAAARRLPPQLADAPKRGFPVPLADWLRQEKYYALVKAKLTGPAAEHFFDTGALCALLDAHRAGKTNAMTKLWAFYCFIEWYEVYFTGKIPPDL